MAAAGAAAAMPAFQGLNLLAAAGRPSAPKGNGGYGPLLPTPDLRDGVSRIALPEGFSCRSFSLAGTTMSDGNKVPLAHDGMGVFNMENGKFRLVRNHEDRNAPGAGTAAIDAAKSYDLMGGGGTTTLEINPFTRQLERHWLSLSGTTVNCAGGITPWNSWITCEETNVGTPTGWLKQHGYCFDVPAGADSLVAAVAIPEMGRFSHEAVTVDPATHIVYETEDNSGGGGSSGFYRFIPNVKGDLTQGGRLQMIAILGNFQYDDRNNQTVGAPLPVTWVDIANPNPPGTTATAVFNQGRALGGARFRRLEGCWWGNGAVYFADTSGGQAGCGTIWEFRPDGDGGTLTLIFESANSHPVGFSRQPRGVPAGLAAALRRRRRRTIHAGCDARRADLRLRQEPRDDYEWAGATFAEGNPAWNDRKIRGNHQPLLGRWDRVTLFVNLQGETGGDNPPEAGRRGNDVRDLGTVGRRSALERRQKAKGRS